ncbi:hypothetical protein GMOD_00007550 [Pyrenophora seminiperda CCB06]|uniref:DNA-directed RNA polymerases I, II, and III subunit RPABC3 n=1 Tax=Pyrenophora seminiperda CCB06 TaxID=1302712 RepID=A0A3M7MDI8_9PLEO|nr:hypothetical protein GMOD_00007550 [Pyrenophora seminiperda CCB06]
MYESGRRLRSEGLQDNRRGATLGRTYRDAAWAAELSIDARRFTVRASLTMADAQVFEETFNIRAINNKKYDRVSRILGTSTDSQIKMTLDINHELFPVTKGASINLVLATTLALDGSAKGENDTMWRNVGRQGVTTLADMYDYVCYGKNYRMEGGDGEIIKYYASFGGLLLYMEGPHRKLSGLKIDDIYMLIKHV